MAAPGNTTWTFPLQVAALARELDQAKRSEWSRDKLRDKIDDWLVTLFDLHPWRLKNAFGAPLNGSEKDIFVDTRLLLGPPPRETQHTKLQIVERHPERENPGDMQECYTSLPFYAVSRSWDDGGNPTLTAVVSVEIVIASATTIWVTIDLEDGRSTEVTLRELGGVVLVNPQQGEVAELVMALAKFDQLTALHHLRDKSLKHEGIDNQRCVRLFCDCNQYVHSDMAEFLKCTESDDEDSIAKLYGTVWHYTMPHDLSLWDKEHTLICFQFQARLVTLANESWVILQPNCGWVEEHRNKIKIAEDVSLVWGWQRNDPRDKLSTSTDQGQIKEIGTLPPYCVIRTSKEAVQGILEDAIARTSKVPNWPFRRESDFFNFGASAADNLCEYLDGPRNVPPTELPRRLWNVQTNALLENFPEDTTYCAVSYVWGQFKGQNRCPDLDRIRRSLKEVADETGVDLFWVDGKCIIQDDEMDKARELPKMGQYYGGASFTLVLLPDVTERHNTLNPIPWQVIDADAHRKKNKKLLDQYVQCQWLKRIWTMQEAWLARKLVFKTYGAGGGLLRGDYLELLRTTGPIIEQYGAVPVCLEWMNAGPALVLGACTGDLISPRETPTLLTRPAGSLLDNNDGTGLQPRTTSLYRALRLCHGRGCDPKKPSGKLIGLLGMVDRGDELTAETMEAASARPENPLEGNPEQAFRLAVVKRMLGAEILLCGTRSRERGCSWLPNLREGPDGVELPYTASKVLENPPLMTVTKDGASVRALEADLTDIKIEGRNTVGSGERGYKYSCTLKTVSGCTKRARIESVELVSRKRRNVLMLQRPSKSGAFIAVRGHPQNGEFYQRKQGFLLILAERDDVVPLEDICQRDFCKRIIG